MECGMRDVESSMLHVCFNYRGYLREIIIGPLEEAPAKLRHHLHPQYHLELLESDLRSKGPV
jgi:hypothetical protein